MTSDLPAPATFDLDTLAIELLDIASRPVCSHDKEQCFRLALMAAYNFGLADAHAVSIRKCDDILRQLRKLGVAA